MKAFQLPAKLRWRWKGLPFRQATYVPLAMLLAAMVLVPGSVGAAPPVLKQLQPWGAQRGTTITLKLVGEGLQAGAEIITTLPGSLARFSPPKDLAQPGTQLPFLLQLPSDAPVGLYPLRIRTEQGLSNILLFSVGDLPESSEQEPNDAPSQAQHVTLPTTLNGTLKETDRDYYRFSAQAGERLVFEVEARRAGSAIDPVIQVLDSNGREIASNNDAPGLDVDARVEVALDAPGDYLVLVHDSRYSDQEQNFYRLKMGAFAYAEDLFPLGWKRGGKVEVTLFGGNLKEPVKVTPNLVVPSSVKTVDVGLPGPKPLASLPFRFVLSDFPEVLEPEEDSVAELEPSTVMNGRISEPGETDRYQVRVAPGQRWVFELDAASLGTSRLDGILTVYDSKGKRLASADDEKGIDPRLIFEVPEDKELREVVVAVEDLHGRGGPGFGYRLLATRRPPDFDLELLTPFVNVPVNGTASVGVKVTRYGYKGPIQLSIPPEQSQDFIVEGGYIRPSGLMSGSRKMGTEGILTLSARLGAELRAVEWEVWGEGGSLAQPIRKRAGAPGMVTVVKGSYEKKDPLFGLRNVNYKPFSAFWLGLNLPVAITRPVPVKLKIAEKHIRMVAGTKREIKVKVERQVRGPIELKAKGGGSAVRLDEKASKVEENADTGTVTLIASARTTEVLGKLDLVLEGTLKINGKEVTVEAPAIRVEVVPAYSIQLLSNQTELKAGGKAELRGIVHREPSVSEPVKIEVRNLPEHVSCTAAEVPARTAELRLVCEANTAAKPGQFDIEVTSSTEIAVGKKKRNYSIDPVKTRLVILGSATAEASARASGEGS